MGARKRDADCTKELDALFERNAALYSLWGKGSLARSGEPKARAKVRQNAGSSVVDDDPIGPLAVAVQDLHLVDLAANPWKVSRVNSVYVISSTPSPG